MPAPPALRPHARPRPRRAAADPRARALQARRTEPWPLPPIGHNNGPPLSPPNGWSRICWKKAQAEAWKNPPIEVVRSRVRRARELGMSYREYTLEILERGRYL